MIYYPLTRWWWCTTWSDCRIFFRISSQRSMTFKRDKYLTLSKNDFFSCRPATDTRQTSGWTHPFWTTSPLSLPLLGKVIFAIVFFAWFEVSLRIIDSALVPSLMSLSFFNFHKSGQLDFALGLSAQAHIFVRFWPRCTKRKLTIIVRCHKDDERATWSMRQTTMQTQPSTKLAL